MKVWPIDPLVPRNLRLEVPEKLSLVTFPDSTAGHLPPQCNILRVLAFFLVGRYQQLLPSSQITRGWVLYRGRDFKYDRMYPLRGYKT